MQLENPSVLRVLAGLLCVGEAWPKARIEALGNSAEGLEAKLFSKFIIVSRVVGPKINHCSLEFEKRLKSLQNVVVFGVHPCHWVFAEATALMEVGLLEDVS